MKMRPLLVRLPGYSTALLALVLAGCSTAPTPLSQARAAQDKADKAANEWQEAAVKESEFVSKRADNLQVGMTLQEANTVLYRGVLTGERFGSVSSTIGADGKLDVYRTTVLGGYPDVWLTFYNDKLQSWTVMPQP